MGLIGGILLMLQPITLAEETKSLATPLKQKITPRVEFGQRLEPFGRVLSGAGQNFAMSAEKKLGGYDAFATAMPEGIKPALCSEYVSLKMKGVEKYIAHSIGKNLLKYPWYVVPQIGVSMVVNEGSKPDHYENQVAEGEYDTQIAALCRGLKTLNRPVYLRIGYEFNGFWNGYRPEPYKKAFIRITQALRGAKLDDVATVWCCRGGGGKNKKELEEFYPGDQWVDWFGIDLWNKDQFTSRSTGLRTLLDMAMNHHKPVIICESTPHGLFINKGQEAWANWFQPYFAMIEREPIIKAFVYINWNWKNSRWPTWGDGDIENSPLIVKHIRETLVSPLYLNALPTREAFLKNLRK